MAFLNNVLEPPAYGWTDANGDLAKPTPKQLFKEFFSRLNVFKDKKNWLSFTSWMMIVVLAPFLFLFIFKYFTIKLLIVAFVYSMIVMGTHGTIWHHRYCTHGAYQFSNGFWRFFTQNLTLKILKRSTRYRTTCITLCQINPVTPIMHRAAFYTVSWRM